MNRDTVKKHQRRYLGYNLAAFAVIFTLFGLIIYQQIYDALFTGVVEDMLMARETISRSKDFVEQQRQRRFDVEWEVKPPKPEDEYGPHYSMRFHVLLWDSSGIVLNEQTLGRIFWEDQLDQIPFQPENMDEVTAFRLEDGSRYRSLLFQVSDDNDETFYVQLIANVDGEQSVIDNFLRILVVCVAIFAFLAFAASYFLAGKSMAPLIKSWERQTEFVENASHELRTPLTIIQNKLEGLLTTPQATVLEKADSIAVSLAETRRLGKLTSNLMTLARADSDQTLLQKERFSLDALVEELCQPYTELAEMQEKTLNLHLEHSGELYADRERIHELLVILLDNALKYTQEGESITIATVRQEGRTVLRVEDTGIGIGEESRSRVFDRFYREDKARSREHGGTGLGLSIAKWIIDVHGGSIRIFSNAPKGSVFEVRIPK